MKQYSHSGPVKTFLKDESGAVLILFTVLVPVMMGIIGLVLDGGRVFIVNNTLQDLADAASLAGARELNGESDAIDRATAAALASAVDNEQELSWSNVAFSGSHIETPIDFCENLTGTPPNRDCDGTTLDPARAHFIKITTVNRGVLPTFLAAVGAGTAVQTNAIAIAGSHVVACDITPLMMCDTLNEADFQPGVMYELKGAGQLGPGAFALLDPPNMTSSGANVTRELLASTEPNFCFVNDVSLATGERTASIQQGLNVRLDEYPPGAIGAHLSQYPPAPNVTKGKAFTQTGQNCQFDDVSGPGELESLPLDDCFSSAGGCLQLENSRIGDGNWNRDGYWDANHSTKTKPAGWDSFTRYQAYMWELSPNADGVPQFTNMPHHPSAQENPEPQCIDVKNPGAPAGAPSRRTMYVAVVDCSGITGNATPDFRSARYAKFFLVRPSVNGEIIAEFMEWITPDDDSGVLRQIVQLYR